jgi:RNA recognition motif-containing protein
MSKAPVRTVFIGNIPFDATDEQMKDIFGEVGVIAYFRYALLLACWRVFDW